MQCNPSGPAAAPLHHRGHPAIDGAGGGGAFDDTSGALRLAASTVTRNYANGGSGVYNLGTLDVDALSRISKNCASTGEDNRFDVPG